MNIIFTGSKYSACINTCNKNLCKTILNENSINTPNSILLNNLKNCSNNPFDCFEKKFGYKPNLFMKPCEDGSSIDIFKISNDEDYKKICDKWSDKVLQVFDTFPKFDWEK